MNLTPPLGVVLIIKTSNVSIFGIFPSWNWLQEPSKRIVFNTGNSELLYVFYFNRHHCSKVNNPLNRKDHKMVLWIPWCSHAQSLSTLQWAEFNPSWLRKQSSVTGLVFISLWCTSYLSVNTLHMLSNHFLKINLIIRKVLLSSLITKNFTFHVSFHVLGYIVSKHKFYWVIEDSEEIWKLLTAAFINNLSEHKTYRKDSTEIVS